LNKEKICPCCGEHHFQHLNFYETCPVCYWQDDSIQRKKPDYCGGANRLSLNEHKKQWNEQRTKQAV